MESSWKKYYLWKHETQKIRKISNPKPSCFWFYFLDVYFGYIFLIYILDLFFVYIFWIYIFKIILGRWGIGNYTFSSLSSTPTWIWISFMSKTWTGFYPKLGVFLEGTLNFFMFKKGNHKTLISLLVRDPRASYNIR